MHKNGKKGSEGIWAEYQQRAQECSTHCTINFVTYLEVIPQALCSHLSVECGVMEDRGLSHFSLNSSQQGCSKYLLYALHHTKSCGERHTNMKCRLHPSPLGKTGTRINSAVAPQGKSSFLGAKEEKWETRHFLILLSLVGKKMAPAENVLNTGFAERIIGALDRNDPRPGLGSRALLQ